MGLELWGLRLKVLGRSGFGGWGVRVGRSCRAHGHPQSERLCLRSSKGVGMGLNYRAVLESTHKKKAVVFWGSILGPLHVEFIAWLRGFGDLRLGKMLWTDLGCRVKGLEQGMAPGLERHGIVGKELLTRKHVPSSYVRRFVGLGFA